ncbi:hypothetical protein GE09DRAFT_623546 [Coniochaeta sp. 2T2.1]|nr:hypothetical protein GE09DRAFT_623546 [Coniochaeta sp. 2T2.1]
MREKLRCGHRSGAWLRLGINDANWNGAAPTHASHFITNSKWKETFKALRFHHIASRRHSTWLVPHAPQSTKPMHTPRQTTLEPTGATPQALSSVIRLPQNVEIRQALMMEAINPFRPDARPYKCTVPVAPLSFVRCSWPVSPFCFSITNRIKDTLTYQIRTLLCGEPSRFRWTSLTPPLFSCFYTIKHSLQVFLQQTLSILYISNTQSA